MEDIEKLKQKIENRKSLMLYNKELEKEYERDIEAIENLINKNKEQEEYIEELTDYIKKASFGKGVCDICDRKRTCVECIKFYLPLLREGK